MAKKPKSIVDQFAEIGKEMADALNGFFEGGEIFDTEETKEPESKEVVIDGTEESGKQRKPANTFKPVSPGKKGAKVISGNGGSGGDKSGGVSGEKKKPESESDESAENESGAKDE